MKIKKHPGTGLWVREDGAVLLPPYPRSGRFKHTWTYGYDGGKGYLSVSFHSKQYSVHRLIAGAFFENRLNLPTVDHIDRNPSNNRVDNLRWASYETQENNRQICEDSLAKYGVRSCDDYLSYRRAYYANNPEYAERGRAYCREYYHTVVASNPEYAERERARKRAYNRARYAADPEYAEQQRARNREYLRARRAKDPEFVEQQRARNREYHAKHREEINAKNAARRAKQKALGKRYRRCPDGRQHFLTDEEFNRLYKDGLK